MGADARAALGSLLGASDLRAAEAAEAAEAAAEQAQRAVAAPGAPGAPGDHLEMMAQAAGVPSMNEGDALAFLARSWAAEMRQDNTPRQYPYPRGPEVPLGHTRKAPAPPAEVSALRSSVQSLGASSVRYDDDWESDEEEDEAAAAAQAQAEAEEAAVEAAEAKEWAAVETAAAAEVEAAVAAAARAAAARAAVRAFAGTGSMRCTWECSPAEGSRWHAWPRSSPW